VSTPLVLHIQVSGLFVSLAPLADLGAFHVEDWIDRLAAVVSTPLGLDIYISGFLVSLAPLSDFGAFRVEERS
jgi:hypothetical protein